MHQFNTVEAKNNINYSIHAYRYASNYMEKHAESLLCFFEKKMKHLSKLVRNDKNFESL